MSEFRKCSARSIAYYSKEEYEKWKEKCDRKQTLVKCIESLIRSKNIEELIAIEKYICDIKIIESND